MSASPLDTSVSEIGYHIIYFYSDNLTKQNQFMAYIEQPMTKLTDCNNPLFQGFYVGQHLITEEQFNEMTTRYNPSLTTGRIFSQAEIAAKLTRLDCARQHLEVGTLDPVGMGNPNSNSDIDIYPTDTTTDKETRPYSVGLFRGIIAMFSPDEIHFFKSRRPTGDGLMKYDIAFKVFRGGMTGPVYIGNISGLP